MEWKYGISPERFLEIAPILVVKALEEALLERKKEVDGLQLGYGEVLKSEYETLAFAFDKSSLYVNHGGVYSEYDQANVRAANEALREALHGNDKSFWYLGHHSGDEDCWEIDFPEETLDFKHFVSFQQHEWHANVALELADVDNVFSQYFSCLTHQLSIWWPDPEADYGVMSPLEKYLFRLENDPILSGVTRVYRPYDWENYGISYQFTVFAPEIFTRLTVDNKKAQRALLKGFVTLDEIPSQLFSPERASDLAQWLASKDQEEETF
jgi:hypothetical protein